MRAPVGEAAQGAQLLDSGLRDFPAATDNALVLVPRHPAMVARTEELASYISGYGLARVYVMTSLPTGSGSLTPGDLPLEGLPVQKADAPLLIGTHEPDGRLDLTFVSGRYGTGRIPAPSRFRARDGAQLAYHHATCDADRAVILVPGASAHGELYAPFARYLAHQGLANAYVLNLRGHYLSDGRPGDVDHVAQLEDDLSDLIGHLKSQSPRTRIVLAGHSMGAGLVLRFAGGPYAEQVDGYMLLAPYLGPLTSTTRAGGNNGWVRVHKGRAVMLAALNALGLRAWNHATLLEFDLPQAVRDGTEVLRYSYRMAAALTPPLAYRRCLSGIPRPTLALIGSQDEMFEPTAYPAAFAGAASTRLRTVPEATHLGLMFHPETHRICAEWLLGGFPA